MELKEYMDEINTIFRRHTRSGFVDYYHCRRLASDMENLLEKAMRDLPKSGLYKELFDISCRAFIKWGNTNKDDSDGETQYFCELVNDAWNAVYNAGAENISHSKMLDWFMKNLDGSVIDYMEDDIYEFMAAHFTEPELMQRKLDFYNFQIAEAARKLKAPELEHKYYREFTITRCHEYILRLKADMGCPIEEIRKYSESFKSHSAKEIMADIEKRYRNTDRVIALYRELADAEDSRIFSKCEWRTKLKDLFREIGDRENYELELKAAMDIQIGNLELWKEYKSLFSNEDWPKIREACFLRMNPCDHRPLPWYEEENRYDLIMKAIELGNSAETLKHYEKKLKKIYPERCLNVLSSYAENQAAEAHERRDYRNIAKILSRIEKYDNGDEIAHQLAEEFRARFPRRTAMFDELEGF